MFRLLSLKSLAFKQSLLKIGPMRYSAQINCSQHLISKSLALKPQMRIFGSTKPTLNEMEQAYEKGEFQRAIELGNEILSEQKSQGVSDISLTLYQLGRSYFESNDQTLRQKSIEYFSESLRIACYNKNNYSLEQVLRILQFIGLSGYSIPNFPEQLSELIEFYSISNFVENGFQLRLQNMKDVIQRESGDLSTSQFEKQYEKWKQIMEEMNTFFENQDSLDQNSSQLLFNKKKQQYYIDELKESCLEQFQLELDRRNFKQALIFMDRYLDFEKQSHYESLEKGEEQFFMVQMKYLSQYYQLTNQKEKLVALLQSAKSAFLRNKQMGNTFVILYLFEVSLLAEDIPSQVYFLQLLISNQMFMNNLINKPSTQRKNYPNVRFLFQISVHYCQIKQPEFAREALEQYVKINKDLIYSPFSEIQLKTYDASLLEMEGRLAEAIYCLQDCIDKNKGLIGENREQIKRLELQILKIEMMILIESRSKITEQAIQELESKMEVCLKVLKEKGTFGAKLEFEVEEQLKKLKSELKTNS